MAKETKLNIDDLESADALTEEELQMISAGTLKPDENGYVEITRDGKTVLVKPKGAQILTPTEFGRV